MPPDEEMAFCPHTFFNPACQQLCYALGKGQYYVTERNRSINQLWGFLVLQSGPRVLRNEDGPGKGLLNTLIHISL